MKSSVYYGSLTNFGLSSFQVVPLIVVKSDIGTVFKFVSMLSSAGHSTTDLNTDSISTLGISKVTIPAITPENAPAFYAIGALTMGKYEANCIPLMAPQIYAILP